MQINKVILYSLKGEKRILPFNLGKVNIITGESKSGKSALIEIVNYCLASSGCDIPEGIIRDTVSYFSVIVTFEDSESVFIARENPNIKGIIASTTVQLTRNIGVYNYQNKSTEILLFHIIQAICSTCIISFSCFCK